MDKPDSAAPPHTMLNEAVGPDWIDDCKRYRGQVLTGRFRHWCFEWDSLPVDETTDEFGSCTCTWGVPEQEAEFEAAKKKIREERQ